MVGRLCLSVRQPWAWAILHAGKDIENRDWSTHRRGRIYLHAAKGMTRAEYEDGMETIQRTASTGLTTPAFAALDRGGIVGTVEIVDCVSRSASPWFFGRYGFALRDPRPLPFVPCKGALGFFPLPDEARAALAQIGAGNG